MAESGSGVSAGSAARSPTISIIGLTGRGRVLGRALRSIRTNYTLRGHDRDPERARGAVRDGAVDDSDWNLVAAAERADLLVLAEPLDELLETLAQVAPHLRTGTLVTDLATVKAPVLRAAEQCLPEGVSFVGGHPILMRSAGGSDEHLFRGACYCLVPLESASDQAVDVLSRLVSALGAVPYFIDAEEHDALMAGVAQLPYLIDSALMYVLGGSPSADDLRRLAGPALRAGLRCDGEQACDIRHSLARDPEGALRWLDALVRELQTVRACLTAPGESRLEEFLAEADALRAQWGHEAGPRTEAAAFDELDSYSPVRSLLTGRLWPRGRK